MALKNLKVKPNPDKQVNNRAIQVDHPFAPGRKINKNGEEIQDCAFIRRALKSGDLVDCNAKAKAPKSKPAHQAKEKEVEK